MKPNRLTPVLLALVAFGCGGTSPQSSSNAGRTPSIHAEDSLNRQPVPWRDVVVTHFEAPGSGVFAGDSGAGGMDTWEIEVDAPGPVRFGVLDLPNCRFRLLSAKGLEVASSVSGEAVKTVTLSPGRYRVEIINQGTETAMARVGWHESGLGFFASVANAPWPKFHVNAQNTGQGIGKGAIGAQKWTFKMPGSTYSSCSIGADGTIYVSADKLYALKSDGSQKWAFAAPNGFNTSPTIASDGTVYVGGGDNSLYAINPSGTQKWAFQAGGEINSSPAIGSDGTIYFGSDDKNLYAIDSKGTLNWTFQTGDIIESSPAIGPDGTIYVGSDDNSLYAVNPNGSQKWLFPTMSGVGSSPAVGIDGTIYVGSDSVYAINPDGSQKWAYQTTYGVLSSPAIGRDGTVYAGLFASSSGSDLVALNPSDGSQKWSFSTGGINNGSPAIASDGTIFVTSLDKNLYAVNPNGTKKWSFPIGGSGSFDPSPAIGEDGTVYVGSVTASQTNGSFFAIK